MKKKSPRSSRATPSTRHTAKGIEIIDSLKEAIEVERSGIPIEFRFTVRTADFPEEPASYNPARVRATREKLAVSQPLFAHLLGVSPMLIRAWEQGLRTPAPWARRLLDEVNRDPRHWRGMLRKAS